MLAPAAAMAVAAVSCNTVWDNGTPVEVTAGDAIWTGNGASHSIKNTGSTVMRMLAIVITE